MEQDLRVQITSVDQVPGSFPNKQGIVQVTISNDGNENLTDGTLSLFASTDRELDFDNLNSNDDLVEGTELIVLQGTDELLGTIEGINLVGGESQDFTIDFSAEEFTNPSVISPGVYNLIAQVDPDNLVSESDESNNIVIDAVSVEGTDAVLDWNSVFLNAVQAQGKIDLVNGVEYSDDTIPGIAPPIEARHAAILAISQYEAINGINGGESSYLDDSLVPPDGASVEAAAVGAAYQVLTTLFPEQTSTFELQVEESFAEIQDGSAAESIGFAYGVAVAEQILALRADDGTFEAQVPYIPGSEPGEYNEITEYGEVSALLPNFGEVTPFSITSPEDFQPDGPPEYGSEEFIQESELVRLLGGRTDTDETEILRTEDQTEIALFWAYDREDTFRPPGRWIEIAQQVALEQGNSLEDNAHLFAQLNVALADAGIVAWDTKYAFELQRPFNTITQDEISGVTSDPDWEPLLDTPPFPDYISGHSTFGGAAAAVLENFFGEDVSFEITSQELPGVTRTYTGSGNLSSFDQAALENANSRFYGGVHINSSNLDGVATGQEVGDFVSDNFLA